jgi:hypothetical protein
MSQQLTRELLIDIEQAVADGASTDKEIADAIGWNIDTFRDWKQGKRKDGANESTKIHDAIKKGQSRQRKHFLQIAEYALKKRITGYEYEETTEESGLTDKGSFTKTKVVKKSIEPNVTSIIFALVNSGKWKSINREIQIETEKALKHVIRYDLVTSGENDGKT